MKILKAIDKVQQGKKILGTSAIFVGLNAWLLTMGVDLVPYFEHAETALAALNALYVALIAIFRMAQEDFRGMS